MVLVARKLKLLLPLALAGALISACAEPARTGAMVAPVQSNTVLPDGSPLKSAVQLTGVDGGQETNPLWTSEVSNENFRQALELSLKQHTILGDQSLPMTLSAKLLEMDQPLIGISMTVRSKVLYQITNTAGETVYENTIDVPYTAQFSDAFMGVERLRLANEGSIKKNISAFIESLVSRSKNEPASFGAALTSGLHLNLG